VAKVTLSFSCDTEKDADVLAWRDGQDNFSAAVRAAIRASWLHDGLTLGDVLNELGEIKRLLRSGAVATASGRQAEAELLDPEEKAVQDALDGLGR
jgi:hypothetical protein